MIGALPLKPSEKSGCHSRPGPQDLSLNRRFKAGSLGVLPCEATLVRVSKNAVS